MLTETQLAQHHKYITGSKVASILGISPWKSKWQTFCELHGDIEVEDISTTRMRMGHYAELSMAQYCKDELGWELIEGPTEGKFHPDHPFLFGLVDRLQVQEDGWPAYVIEFKNIDKLQKSIWQDNDVIVAPDYYLTQMYFYMALWDLHGRFFIVFGGNDPVSIDVPRNPEIEQFIIAECCRFWDDIQNDRYPDPDSSDSCTQTLQKMFTSDSGEMVGGTDEQLEWAIKYDRARAAEKEAKAEKDLAGNYLREAIRGSHGAGMTFMDGSKVTWKQTKGRLYFDEKRFAIENPKLAESYYSIRPGSRTLLVKLAK